MIFEIPQYGLRAYSLFYSKHGSREPFKQSELDWIVSQSMKKKIFALLLNAGWIIKESRSEYKCVESDKVIQGLSNYKVLELIKNSKRDYAFTNLSAIEIWSDYSYIQRSMDKSPYFIKILRKDLRYWKDFFNKLNIPNYVNKGSNIGEFIILIPVDKINIISKDGLNVESLKETFKIAKNNNMYGYAYNYMREKYGNAAN